ncbi:MAG: hypothetical protein REH83_02375 [Rickettsiella sp.]|nr:hypothetical protein [Rickettsiella sp.]
MSLKKSFKLGCAYFDKQQKAKLNPETVCINELVNILLDDLTPTLTIENIKAQLNSKLSSFVATIDSEKYVLVVYVCEQRSKLFALFLSKMTDLEVHVNTKEEEIMNQVFRISYQFILFNVDYYFPNFKFIFEYMRADDSKNKETPLYLITSDQAHFDGLKNTRFDDNTEVLERFNPNYVAQVLHRFESLYVKNIEWKERLCLK